MYFFVIVFDYSNGFGRHLKPMNKKMKTTKRNTNVELTSMKHHHVTLALVRRFEFDPL